MKVALLANLKKNAPHREGDSRDRWDDLDTPETIDAILTALRRGGHDAVFFEAGVPDRLVPALYTFGPDLCFNIAEGHFGESREAHIPALLEMVQIPYTGSGVLPLTLALDKAMTKRILAYHDLPTPDFQVFGRADDEIHASLMNGDELRWPLFVKPAREGSGVGITGSNIVRSPAELRSRVAHLLDTYRQPVLCERFIEGRELTVGVIGNLRATAARRLDDRTAPVIRPDELHFFPPMEIDTHHYGASEAGIYTNRIKVELASDFHWTCPAAIPEELCERLWRLTAAVFRVVGCHDVARVDFRYDPETDIPWILEVNPLPGLNPDYSDLCIEARSEGWSYEKLILSIVETAATRLGLASLVH